MISLTSKQGTILGATVIALALIGGAYFLSGNEFPIASLQAEDTDELLRAYAAKDTDTDGLPDWQEALYGTDPTNAHSVGEGYTDAEAVNRGLVVPSYNAEAGAKVTADVDTSTIPGPTATPGTVTDQFAQLFFENYLSTRGSARPSSEEMAAFVATGVASLAASQTRTDAYGASDINVHTGGRDALVAYAIAMELAFARAPRLPYSELTYFSDAVSKNDTAALTNVRTIANGYQELAKASAGVSVPQEIATLHLALINAMARLGGSIADMATVTEDPVRGMLGLKNYQEDAAALTASLIALEKTFATIEIKEGAPGFSFLKTLEIVSKAPTP